MSEKFPTPAEFEAFAAKTEREFEAEIAVLEQQPESLSRDCKIADLKSRLEVFKELAGEVRKWSDLAAFEEAHFGGPMPLSPMCQHLFEELEDKLAELKPKPN